MLKPFIPDIEMTNRILEPIFILNSVNKGRHISDTGHTSSIPMALEKETELRRQMYQHTVRSSVVSVSLSLAPKAKWILSW